MAPFSQAAVSLFLSIFKKQQCGGAGVGVQQNHVQPLSKANLVV
jgi:hypothetical protein